MTGIGRVHGRLVALVGNDATVQGRHILPHHCQVCTLSLTSLCTQMHLSERHAVSTNPLNEGKMCMLTLLCDLAWLLGTG